MNKRKIVTNGMIALAVMLFVAMYYTGKNIEKEQDSQEAVKQESSFTFSKEEALSKGAKKSEEQEHMHTYDSLSDSEVEQNIRHLEEAPENERTYSATDFYSEEEVAQAEQVAQTFASEYYAFNGDDMTAHVKRVESVTSPELYRYLLGRTGRATNSAFKAHLKKLEVKETYDQVKDYIVFEAHITGEVYGNDGSFFEEQKYVYYMKVQRAVNEFKVVDLQQAKVK
ncbi:hypothetical protein SAMN05880501_1139 [Ureibacillus xyleni]|uniref:Uncharacterized protein n=1 Tax=Ureibacillus xyleni TaxID=614648 RepID=A0A285TLE5_9BACL|nr:hypothetical protein [Ureibacillus xyleni]SOC21536.1 hypothetical protein SAMN05880501_1139 [Ureibacillus xyleni]